MLGIAHKAKRRVRFRLSAEQQPMLMRYVRNPPANSDLDQIRYDVAAQSGSLDIADRRMDLIADRFLRLAKYPNLGRAQSRIAPCSSEFSRRASASSCAVIAMRMW
jgi:plasmid stabilization system protein ParE